MDNTTSAPSQTPITQSPSNTPPPNSTQNNGMSHETKTLIVILLLIFVYWVGLVFMWIWMKTWPRWIKFIISLPGVLSLILIPIAIGVAITDPFNQSEKAQNAIAKNVAEEFIDAINRYFYKLEATPCDFSQHNGSTLNNAQDCITPLINENELKESFLLAEELKTVTLKYDSSTNNLSACYGPLLSDCARTTILAPTPTSFDQEGTPSPTASPSAVQDEIESALNSQTYEDLAPYMADFVNFEIEASEGTPPGTPEETVENLNYLNTAAPPWNFDQENAIVNEIRAQYPDEYGELYIGIASNNVLAAFGFNENGEINTIKVAVTYGLLISQ